MTTHIFAAAVGHATEILLTLFIMLAAAKITAEIFERLKQPAVVGEILAGVIIGGSVLDCAFGIYQHARRKSVLSFCFLR